MTQIIAITLGKYSIVVVYLYLGKYVLYILGCNIVILRREWINQVSKLIIRYYIYIYISATGVDVTQPPGRYLVPKPCWLPRAVTDISRSQTQKGQIRKDERSYSTTSNEYHRPFNVKTYEGDRVPSGSGSVNYVKSGPHSQWCTRTITTCHDPPIILNWASMFLIEFDLYERQGK